jgi:protoheme IX farnesyltransferase
MVKAADPAANRVPVGTRPLAPAEASAAVPWMIADLVTLTKPRLNLLVLLTTLCGLYLAAPEGLPLAVVLHTLVGSALVAGGASALNQALERDTDRLMRRTSGRPLPAGRLGAPVATIFGLALAAVGVSELAIWVNYVTAGIALGTLVSYVAAYTPLKTRSSLSTLVGAVPGALPPVIGWSAATGEVSFPALVLFGIVFFWQMPHFLAIAWMYRDDYARAGMPLLPVTEPDGRRTGQQALIYAAVLWPVSLMPTVVGLAGAPYAALATGLGFMFVGLSAFFARERTLATARQLFLFSIIYLPLLLTGLVVDRVWL